MPTPTRAVIAADSPATADAGARVAELGGNAADIAVAAGFVATMAESLLCSLSGSGFAMISPGGGEPELIDGSHTVPGRDSEDRRPPGELDVVEYALPYGGGISIRIGRGTVAVPGAPAMLEETWRRHGRLPWAEVLAPSVELARSGWPASKTMVNYLAQVGPGPYARQEECLRTFFPDREHPPPAGAPFRIAGLEGTMEQIAREGTRALYEGDLASAIVREMASGGGLISRRDLASYRAEVRRPLAIRSREWTLSLNPPPAVGGAALGVMVGWLDRCWPLGSAPGERAVLLARAQRALLELRSGVLDCPDFDDAMARALLEDSGLLPWLPRLSAPGTTQISVATADGGLASMAMSNGYDAGIVIPGTGIVCNNALGEPELNPRGFLAQRPGARIVSNMTPTVAIADDGRRLAIGSPGASRITTALAQTWAWMVFEGLDPGEAVIAPRLHVSPPESAGGRPVARVEPGFDTSRLAREFDIVTYSHPDMYFGGVKLAMVGPGGGLSGRADPRREGAVRSVG
ncbi:gamma-glutamyltransferase [Tautonia sociabilis]|uniref:Gamma-glutamyltranspeptidase n=1 Tax=Tautonia sociabilis TaxID=2080755 RepID=A0A432MG51_9BACT|nr:gamma-glutamyltransferase [Tautonia sociabilis]RUL85292.1 gamma-glutamyltranspeptidase [Tautonia sociabilis]